jgi:hypothetical protein
MQRRRRQDTHTSDHFARASGPRGQVVLELPQKNRARQIAISRVVQLPPEHAADNQRNLCSPSRPGENSSLNLAYVFPTQFPTLPGVVRHQYHVRCLHAYSGRRMGLPLPMQTVYIHVLCDATLLQAASNRSGQNW